MQAEKLDVARGSGKCVRDLGHKNADVEQFKAILAAGTRPRAPDRARRARPHRHCGSAQDDNVDRVADG